MVKLTTVLVLDDKLVFELDQEQRLKVGTFGYDPRGYLKDELHRYGTHHAALEVVKPVAAVVAAMASSVATSLPQSPGTPAPPSRRRWSVPTTPPCTPNTVAERARVSVYDVLMHLNPTLPRLLRGPDALRGPGGNI